MMQHVKLLPVVKFVASHCNGDYTTNLSLNVLIDDDVLLAYHHDGKDLSPEYG